MNKKFQLLLTTTLTITEPEIIKKRAVVEDGLESQIISMYAKGMTVRDISVSAP